MPDYTKEDVVSLFEYKDGKLFRKINSSNQKAGNESGWVKNDGYRAVRFKNKDVLVHRLIFFVHYEFMPVQVDHINGDKTDNRIENLRQASASQNNYNQKISKKNKSGCKNVSWNKTRNKWVVRVKYEKVKLKQWYVDDFEFAELLATEAREKFHGKFARHA